MTNPISALPLRAARWSATHPWRAILGWLALVAVAVGLAIAVPTQETDDADYRMGDSGRADAWVDAAGLDDPSAENVLVSAPDGSALDPAVAESAAADLVAGLREVDGVVTVTEPQWSPDRSALLVAAQLARDQEDPAPLQEVTDRVQADHPGLSIRQAGDLSLDQGINDQVAEDLSAAEGISLPVTLVLMLVAFGALVAAGIPVLLAVTSVIATIGITAPLSHLVHAEPTVGSMIVLIGMAVGVDYSLFFLKREREERARGAGTVDAVEIAAATSGHSIIVSGLAVLALSAPALGMKLQAADLETLPDSIPGVTTFRAMADLFPSEGTTATVVVHGNPGRAAEVRAGLADLEARATGTGVFEATPDAVRTSADRRTAVLRLALPYEESDPRVERAVENLRADLAPAALDRVDGVDVAVGGDAAESRDFVANLRTWLPVVVGFVLLLTMVMMGVAFRSVPIALVSCVLNLASVGVAFGLLSLVFQHGVGEGLLDFRSPGFVIDWIPLFVLVVLVGLSMDYHVFVLSRVREHVQRGLPARLAVEKGIADTAGVVTSAAAVMVSVFAIFATLSMLEMKMMGVGLSAAILVDATIIRLVMLPAILVLLGERAWWPGTVSTPRGEFVAEPESVPSYSLRAGA